ncbi:hypothetical protein ACFUC1_08975 [Pedococcus sp. NPDC057267]|uniref:hypothetical protein n=1 Tax=Pedococcus sp. NPDC057267 TaxID=3346077 RepID=UPI00363E8BB9
MSDARHRDRQPLNQWLMLQPSVWVPFVWWALVVASVIASFAGDPGTVCTVARPCQPDAIFPMVVALVGIALVAFWWEPVAALAAGLGYAALSLLFDPSMPGRYAGVLVACAATAGLAVLRHRRGQQAHVAVEAAEVSPTVTPFNPAAVEGRRRRWLASALLPVVGVAGLLLVAGSVLGYRAQTAGEQAHIDRAERANARVVTLTDDNYKQLFQLEDGPRAGQKVSIEVTEELDQGSRWVVLLDPQDPTWSRLLSEPKGYTYWFGWAVLGGCMSTWALLQLLLAARAGREDQAPAVHRVRVAHDGRAELTLAGGGSPVATVLLGGVVPSTGGRAVPARVRGRVADGSWVVIETDAGALPVVGPVRSVRRWRDLNIDAGTHPLLGSIVGRSRGVGFVARQAFFVAFGCFMLWFALGEVGATWDAAHGRGVPGSFTVIRVDCGGKGPCSHYGDFRSNDGQYSFTDVELVGDAADVGESIPALYEGHSGETPDEVFAPGWTGAAENALFLALGLGFLLEPLGRGVGALRLRRQPPTGRHAHGRS